MFFLRIIYKINSINSHLEDIVMNATQDEDTQLRAQEKPILTGLTQTSPSSYQQHNDEHLHKLPVHQTELDMQNEKLRGASVALEMSYSHYADLYDLAPVAYLTLSAEGLIAEINLTGAKLLGIAAR